jgi:menaquinone-dependent protoporphyrinogen IX oxidase
MAEPSLDFIGRQLQSIQADLQQIKFAADVDRRNTGSQYDNLVVAVGVKIGAFEATVEHRINALREELLDRFDRIEQLLKNGKV